MTLKDILKKHPDWADLDVVICRRDGEYDYIDHAGFYYKDIDVDEETGEEYDVLVFSAN